MRLKLKKLNDEIINWHKARFPNVTGQEVIDKCFEELEELYVESGVTWPRAQSYIDEFADVYITHLIYYTRCLGVSFEDLIRDKFEKVKDKYGR